MNMFRGKIRHWLYYQWKGENRIRWERLKANSCHELSKHAAKTTCYIKEKHSPPIFVSSFSSVLKCARVEMCRKRRRKAALRPEYPKIWFVFTKYTTPPPQKTTQQRLWKTKYSSLIRCSCSNNSFAAPWQYFNTTGLLNHTQRAWGGGGGGGQRQEIRHLVPNHFRHSCLSYLGTDLHWFCDKWIRLCFNWICAFGVPQANCVRPRRLRTQDRRDTQHRIITPGRRQRTGPPFITRVSPVGQLQTPISSRRQELWSITAVWSPKNILVTVSSGLLQVMLL